MEITSCCGNCWRGADRNRGLCVPVRTSGPQLDGGQPVWVYPGPKQVLAHWGRKHWFLQRQHHKLEVDAVTGNDGGGVASPMTLRGVGGQRQAGAQSKGQIFRAAEWGLPLTNRYMSTQRKTLGASRDTWEWWEGRSPGSQAHGVSCCHNLSAKDSVISFVDDDYWSICYIHRISCI